MVEKLNDSFTIDQISFLYYGNNVKKLFLCYEISEAATQRCSQEKLFWKYAANLQENTRAEVWFQ